MSASPRSGDAGRVAVDGGRQPLKLLVDLLDRVVTGHDTAPISDYLDPGFRLWCNGTPLDYQRFIDRVAAALAGNRGYAVDYDDQSWVSGPDRVAARLWIASAPADAEPSDSEVLLIATVHDGRFDRAWVLAWPDHPQLHQHSPDDHPTTLTHPNGDDR